MTLTFKEEFIREIEGELKRPFKPGMSRKEFAAYKEGLIKSLMVFKRLSRGKNVILCDAFLDEPLKRIGDEDL